MIKYAALKLELGRMWKMECEVVPIVVGVLGGVTTEIRSNLESVPGSPDFAICQTRSGIINEFAFKSWG